MHAHTLIFRRPGSRATAVPPARQIGSQPPRPPARRPGLLIAVLLGALLGTPLAAQAGPIATFSSTSLGFGDTPFGKISDLYLIVTNTGDADLTISSVSITGANPIDFGVIGPIESDTLAPGKHGSIHLGFSPTGLGPRSASLAISTNAPGSPHVVALSGFGRGGAPSLSPDRLVFPLRPVGSTSSPQCVTLTNTGNSFLQLERAPVLEGADPGDFTITGGPGPGFELPINQSQQICITFTPKAAGTRTAVLTLYYYDALFGRSQLPLSGIGVATGGPSMPPVPTNAVLFVSAIDGSPTSGQPDQVTIAAGRCLSLTMLVKFRSGAFLDVTNDPGTHFFLDQGSQGRVTLTGNSFCATQADRNKTFPIYGQTASPDGQQTITDTVIVHVHR